MASTLAMATRFFCPPESWYGARSARSVISSMARVSLTRSSAWSRLRAMLRGPKAISSRTVGQNTWASEFWKMNPIRERNAVLNCSSSSLSSVTTSPKAV